MKRLLALTLAVAVTGFTQDAFAGDEITVMTQNQYLGANLDPVVAAPDAAAFNAALIDALEQIAANNLPERAAALAEQIDDRQPHLAGLQEVFAFGCFDLAPPTPEEGCDDPAIAGAFNDHLTETLGALGPGYEAVATVVNLDLTDNLGIPGFPVPGLPVDLSEPPDGIPDISVTVLDRDVILARADVIPYVSVVPVGDLCGANASADGCNYQVVAVAPTPIGPIPIQRGFVAVDAIVGGSSYRFVNTHLEVQNPDPTNPLSPLVQALQASELNRILGFIPGPERLIVVGDINSSSEDPPFFTDVFGLIFPPYTQFSDGVDFMGFPIFQGAYTDAWDLRPGNDPGFTCCELSDLSNPKTLDDERIDVLFSLAPPGRVKANVLGNEPSDKTSPSRLWPSDHAAVVGTLTFD